MDRSPPPTPVESLLDRVKWTEAPAQEPDPHLPHVTHSGVLVIGIFSLRCYRLSDGRAVFDADDFRAFLGPLL